MQFGGREQRLEKDRRQMRRWSIGGVAGILVVLGAFFFALGESPGGSPNSSCVAAGQALLEQIDLLLTVEGGGSLRDGMVAKGSNYQSAAGPTETVWFVAAEIDGPGLESRGDIGIWATNTLDGSSTILSVDAIAYEFSEWFYGPDLPHVFGPISQFDDGAEEARSCQEARD